MTCSTCVHCNTDEATEILQRFSAVRHVCPGICTKAGSFFDSEFVPVWLAGCPDYEPRTSPQGDGDGGEE